MTDQPHTDRAAATLALTFNIAYPDGAHTVVSRPGDTILMQRAYPGATGAELDDPIKAEASMYLAWLASRHDVAPFVRSDFEAFLTDVVSLEVVRTPAVPTGAAPGNGSQSRLPSPPDPIPVGGSTPSPQPW